MNAYLCIHITMYEKLATSLQVTDTDAPEDNFYYTKFAMAWVLPCIVYLVSRHHQYLQVLYRTLYLIVPEPPLYRYQSNTSWIL